MSEKKPMTPSDAARIQSHADRTGVHQDFKARAQRVAAEPPAPKSTEKK